MKPFIIFVNYEKNMKPFLRILRYIFRYRALVILSLVCSMVYASMNAFSAYLIGPFMETLFIGRSGAAAARKVLPVDPSLFDRIKVGLRHYVDMALGNGDPHETLTRLCILIIAVIFTKNVFSYVQGYVMAYIEQGVVRDLRRDLYEAYHRLPLRFYQKRKTGDFISRVINDCNTINTNLNSSLIDLMKEPINIISLLAFMVVLSWKLTAFTFLIAPPSLYIIGKISKKLRRRTTKTQDRVSNITSVLDETISNIRVVKAFAMEAFEVRRFNKGNDDYFKSLLRLFRIKRLASPLTEFLGVSMAVAVLWIGGRLVIENRGLAPDHFIEFIVLMFLLMQSAKRLSDVQVKILVGVAATDRVFEIIDLKSDIADPLKPKEIDSAVSEIRFDNVWYEYDPGVPVLKGIDLNVQAGENIAIVGPSGGGKTTLVDLLPRFYDPVKGAITINGTDIRDYRLDDLRGLFGIVTQETMLFHDTIRANIAYGRPDIPIEDIERAAKTAYAHDFIMKFEYGYDTVIGDRGTKLSGGQKQRLVIARAILKNPPILIFDEATSALDSESEAEVQSAIDKLLEGRTSFVIAHRLSTIHKATRIIVIENGRIAETGSHKELYDKGGIYRRLNDIQFANR